jgi:hypothetical protein
MQKRKKRHRKELEATQTTAVLEEDPIAIVWSEVLGLRVQILQLTQLIRETIAERRR